MSEWYLVVDPPFYSHACKAHEQGTYMYVLFPPCHDGSLERRSPGRNLTRLHQFPRDFATLGFAAKTESRQLRRLAIGSYTTVLADGFSSKCHLDKCLRVSPDNPCWISSSLRTGSQRGRKKKIRRAWRVGVGASFVTPRAASEASGTRGSL